MRNAKQKKLTIPKFLFYKYGLENKIMAIYLENYVGVKGNGVASNSRRRFNKLLLSDVEIKSQWESFKIFVDENRVK